LITAYQKRCNIPEWGDEMTTKTKYNLPPFYFYFKKKKEIENKDMSTYFRTRHFIPPSDFRLPPSKDFYIFAGCF